ncbi:hypothetical protein [Bosea massiliensis]|uniref:Uncharacterized protein n=1 Tax=Bosea massiliensis TaxID=151419 RepID=A0ABW0PB53_9HYPH
MSKARNLAQFANRTLISAKLAANGQFLVFDVEPDTLYRFDLKAKAVSADDTLVFHVAPTVGAWVTGAGTYSYQQHVATGATPGSSSGTAAAVPIASLDAPVTGWPVRYSGLIFSGAAAEYAGIYGNGGGVQASGAPQVYQIDGVYNVSLGAVAQVRFGVGTAGNLAAGSRCFLEKLG